MKRTRYHHLYAAMLALWVTIGTTADAVATPNPNGASALRIATPNPAGTNILPRIYNDCSNSTFTISNLYPASITMEDVVTTTGPRCPLRYANLHNWSFSEDGGASAATFNNNDSFRYCATLIISGGTDGEAGLIISPWWARNTDGRFNVRTTDGEIACFGGRLPFYSFSDPMGDNLHYVKGTSIYLEIVYIPNALSMTNPATIEYKVRYNSVSYTSGPLPFDGVASSAEAATYGNWGMLNAARVGGHFQPFIAFDELDAKAEWTDICFEAITTCTVPNLAERRPATASASASNTPPSQAFDGNALTKWNAGGYAPQWIAIDLQREISVHCIGLLVDILPAGNVEHMIRGLKADGTDVYLGGFTGVTARGDWLDILAVNHTPVRYVRVTTLSSPSWIGWYEIRVVPSGLLDAEQGSNPIQELMPPSPNPFGPQTTMKFTLRTSGKVELRMYDTVGRMVRRFERGELSAGHHDVVWDGRDESGASLRAGTYFYRLTLNGRDVGTEKVVFLGP